MTYIECYRQCKTVEEIKKRAIIDTKVAIFMGNNPDRIKAIEDAMNQAIGKIEKYELTDHDYCSMVREGRI